MPEIQIPCPQCGAINRMDEKQRDDGGRCGRCSAPLFAGRPVLLTAANFDRHANAVDLPLLVDFWAQWCGPCRAMAPVIDAAARAMEPALRVGKLDTEGEQQLAARFHIRSIPTLILFRGGRELARMSGALPLPQLQQWVHSALAS